MPLFFNLLNPLGEEALFCAYYYEKRDFQKALPLCEDYFKKTGNPLTAKDLATIAYFNGNEKLLEQLKEFALKTKHPARDYILALYYYSKGNKQYIEYLKRYLENNQPSRAELLLLLKPAYESNQPAVLWLYMYRFYKLEPDESKVQLLSKFLLSLDTEHIEEILNLAKKFFKGGDENEFIYTTLVLGYTQLLKENMDINLLKEALPVVVKALKCCPDNQTFLITAYTTLSAAQILGLKLPSEDFYPYNLLKELSQPYPPLGKFEKYLEEVEKLPRNLQMFIYADFLYKETELNNLRLAGEVLNKILEKGFPLISPLNVKVVPYLFEEFLLKPKQVDWKVFKRFEELYPYAPETYLLKALIAVKKGDIEKAKKLLKEIQPGEFPLPEFKDYYTALKIYLFGGDIKKLPPPKAGVVLRIIYKLNPEKAKALAEEYFKNCPETEVFKRVMSRLNPQCLELPEYIASLGVKCHPKDPWLLNFLGYTYLLEGKDLDKALHMLEEAHRLDPDNPDILDSLGWAYYLKGNLHKAEQYVKKALDKRPNEPVVLYHYGKILLEENKPCEAEKVLEESLKRLSELPAEPEKGILKRVKKSLLKAKTECSNRK